MPMRSVHDGICTPKKYDCHLGQSHTPSMEDHPIFLIPSRELTYPQQKCHFEEDVPLPKVGYVSSLEGMWGYIRAREEIILGTVAVLKESLGT